MQNNEQKLAVLFQDASFMEEAKQFQTVEDMQTSLANHGVDMSLEDVTSLCMEIGKQASLDNGEELVEDDLDKVAGGSITVGLIALGVVCLGAFALGVYNGYKDKKK